MALRLKRHLLACALLAAAFGTSTAKADTVTVNVDQARVIRLPDRVATIVIGNPLIADATLQAGGILVVTGKGFGETNLVALDRGGHVILDKTVQVMGPSGGDFVTVYRGAKRESYSCAPECSPRITLGDDSPYFAAVLGQTGVRNGQAKNSASPK